MISHFFEINSTFSSLFQKIEYKRINSNILKVKIQFIILLIILFPIFFTFLKHIGKFKERKKKDILNSSEDGYLLRFPGGIIEYFREEENVHRIVTSQPVYHSENIAASFNMKEIFSLRKTILYQIPVQMNSELLCNFYKQQLDEANFKIIYSDCNENLGKPSDWYKQILMTNKNLFAWNDLSRMLLGKLFCYFSAVKKEEDKKIYLSVYAVNHFRNNKKTGVFIFVSEK